MLCAAYIRNRCPSSLINNKSSYEMWYNRLPVVQHFRVFGSLCYALIPKHQRNKLGDRSCKCISLGYSVTSKAYRLYDEQNKKFILFRDVIFLESNKRGVPILDQFVVLPSLTHENVIAEENLDDNNVSAGLEIAPEEPVLDHVFQEEQPSQPLQQPLRRSTCARKVPSKPNCFLEAANCDEWKDAMQKEYDALINNGTWRLVDPPAGIKPIGCKWVYKIKYKADGLLDKYKARLVEKGYAQKEDIDYTKTFAPTTKWGTIRTLFSLAA
eukprot:PITA_31558